MSVLVDTGVLVAFHNGRDAHHERAIELVEELKDGARGAVYTSDYVFDEAISLAQARTGRAEVVRAVGETVLPEDAREQWISLLHLSAEEFFRSWHSLRAHPKAGLSFTDWTMVEMVRGRRLDSIASFDSGLDAWIPRLS
jgi:predicted nucleic acid-binding protein